MNSQAVVVSLPTIESSFVSHYAKGLQGYAHPDYPALRIAGEILNATESYLWVRGISFSLKGVHILTSL